MENSICILNLRSPWDSVLELLEQECNEFGIVFFDAVTYEGFFDGIVHLTAPDNFRKNWINSHFADLLRRSLKKVLGESFVDYEFRVLAPEVKVPEMKLAAETPKKVAVKPKKILPARKPLPVYAAYTFENFIEGECNSVALKACLSVVENPGDTSMNPLLVYGDSGLGKTHLLHAIAQKIENTRTSMKITYSQAYDFLRESAAIGDAAYKGDKKLQFELQNKFLEKYEKTDVLLIDDIQLLEKGKKSQERLATLIKILRSKGKQVVLSCDRHPSSFKKSDSTLVREAEKSIPQLSQGLLTYVENCVAVGLLAPDFNTRMEVFRHKSGEIPFNAQEKDEIFRFLSIPPKANIRLIEGLLNWLKAMNLFNHAELNLSTVKAMLAQEKTELSLNMKNISEAVAAACEVDFIVLSSNKQDNKTSLTRKIAMYLCKEFTNETLENIGRFFNRDYTTVIASIKSLCTLMDKDSLVARQVQDIRYALEF